jgi:hypothetical protein
VKKYSVAKSELTMFAPVLLLHIMPVPLLMFPEAKFYNVSMTRDAQTLDAVSPKFEEIPDEISHIYTDY